MKYRQVLLLLLLATSLLSARPPSEAAAQSQRPLRVAVLPVRSEAYIWGWQPETAVTGLLEEAVLSSGKATLVDRQQMDTVLREHTLARVGLTDPGGTAAIGNLLGADLLVTGTIVEAAVERGGTVWSPTGDLQLWRVALGLSVRVISTTDGVVIFSRLVRAEAQAVELRLSVGDVTLGLGSREAGLLDRAARIAVDRLRDDLIRTLDAARSRS